MDASIGLELAQSRLRSNRTSTRHAMAQLTSRELEIMRRVAEGFTNAQIAEELQLGVKSVETHRARVMDKLGLASRVALVRLALDCGVLGSGAAVA